MPGITADAFNYDLPDASATPATAHGRAPLAMQTSCRILMGFLGLTYRMLERMFVDPTYWPQSCVRQWLSIQECLNYGMTNPEFDSESAEYWHKQIHNVERRIWELDRMVSSSLGGRGMTNPNFDTAIFLGSPPTRGRSYGQELRGGGDPLQDLRPTEEGPEAEPLVESRVQDLTDLQNLLVAEHEEHLRQENRDRD